MGEATLYAFMVPQGGWVVERPEYLVLPNEAEERMLALFDNKPLRNPANFKLYLRRIFAHTVEVEIIKAQWRNEQKPGKRGRPPKAVTVLLERLAYYREIYDHLADGRVTTSGIFWFFNLLRKERVIYSIAIMKVAETYRISRLQLSGTFITPDRFARFGEILNAVREELLSMHKPGSSAHAFEQMTRALAALYLDETGTMPTRIWDAFDRMGDPDPDAKPNPEKGVLLRLCQLMAEAVCAALPAEIRPATPKMEKTVRRMIDELKAEQSAA